MEKKNFSIPQKLAVMASFFNNPTLSRFSTTGGAGSRPRGGILAITQRERRNARPIYFDDDFIILWFPERENSIYGLLRTAQD